MEIQSYRSNLYFNNKLTFSKLKYKKQSLFSITTDNPKIYCNLKESIKKIANIQPQYMGGTKCKGSIPLKNFWNFFKKDKNIRDFGYSTNSDGFGDSFLKAPAYMPISTSYVHDCSVMYLYNKKEQTHALYHALSNCSQETIKYMLKTLMPEGVSNAAIIPGDAFFYKEHEYNMKNMLKLIKENNPDAVINVYHSTSKYPEIVGIKGMVYQIPNYKVEKQIKSKRIDINDFGQASFKIVDLQGYNTFDEIFYGCNDIKSLFELKKTFHDAKYPKEILKILFSEADKRIKAIEEIKQTKTLEDLKALKSKLTESNLEDIFLHKESLLYDSSRKKFSAKLKNFFQKIKYQKQKLIKIFEYLQKNQKINFN